MNPTIWGPYVWYNFHILSYSYLENEQESYRTFFKSVPYTLPCLTCKEHFKRALIKSPPDKNIVDGETMVKWLNNLHNVVNKRLEKDVVSLDRAYKIYHHKNGELKIDHNKMMKFIKMIKDYVSGGVNSIIIYHGSNILVNYCHICPCSKCRGKLINLLGGYTVSDQGLSKLCDNMIKIIINCK